MGENEDQKAVDAACSKAVNEANFRLTMEIFFTTDGIRPVELPEGIDAKLAEHFVRRMMPTIHAATLQYPGRWRLILRAVAIKTDERNDA
jgi:hypothetical protein